MGSKQKIQKNRFWQNKNLGLKGLRKHRRISDKEIIRSTTYCCVFNYIKYEKKTLGIHYTSGCI